MIPLPSPRSIPSHAIPYECPGASGRGVGARAIVLGCVLAAIAAYPIDAAGQSSQQPCAQAISGETAQRIFERLRNADLDCKLEQVKTERDTTTIIWIGAGGEKEAITIRPLACAAPDAERGKELAVQMSAAFRQRCPGVATEVVALVQADAFGAAIQLGASAPAATPADRTRRTIALVAALIAVALILVLAWRRLRARRGKKAS